MGVRLVESIRFLPLASPAPPLFKLEADLLLLSRDARRFRRFLIWRRVDKNEPDFYCLNVDLSKLFSHHSPSVRRLFHGLKCLALQQDVNFLSK